MGIVLGLPVGAIGGSALGHLDLDLRSAIACAVLLDSALLIVGSVLMMLDKQVGRVLVILSTAVLIAGILAFAYSSLFSGEAGEAGGYIFIGACFVLPAPLGLLIGSVLLWLDARKRSSPVQ